MSIEIKELHIKAVVQDDSINKASPKTSVNTSADTNINSIVERCVEQVLSILKEKQER